MLPTDGIMIYKAFVTRFALLTPRRRAAAAAHGREDSPSEHKNVTSFSPPTHNKCSAYVCSSECVRISL